jgi:hypothetical protein
MKKRNQKMKEYNDKYSKIPRDYKERLAWMYDKLHINSVKADTVIANYNTMKDSLYYKRYKVILYEIPEGSPRPRMRLINRKNFANMAMKNSNFIQVYSPVGAEDNKFMKKLVSNTEFNQLQHLIYTPCIVHYEAYLKTPSTYNAVDTYLAELGIHRPINKPDWDNIGKKYCDMTNENLWVDDRLVIKGTVEKYYSILPRIEITIDYLNMLTNIKQAESMSKTYNGDIRYFGDGRC